MTDRISQAQRSEVMSHIQSANTQPEIRVRKLLHQMGYRFRLHRSDLPGNPDIVLPKHKAIIMVHGCFWHQHPHCEDGHLPKSNLTYWKPKLEKNVLRDHEAQRKLSALGWRVLIVWDCETKEISQLKHKLSRFFERLSDK